MSRWERAPSASSPASGWRRRPARSASSRGTSRAQSYSSSSSYRRDKVLVDSRFDGTHPRAIVYCESAADVEKTVRWARRHAIHLVPRCGGHSYAGYSTTSTGVVVDVSRMHRVHLRDGVATVGAGARLIDVYAPLAAHGHDDPRRLLPDGRDRRPCARRRCRLRRAQARPDLRQRRRPRARHRRRKAPRVQRARARGSLLGVPRRRRWELRDRHELRVPDAPGRRRRVLPGRLALVRRPTRRRGVAALRTACSRRPVRVALPGDECARGREPSRSSARAASSSAPRASCGR